MWWLWYLMHAANYRGLALFLLFGLERLLLRILKFTGLLSSEFLERRDKKRKSKNYFFLLKTSYGKVFCQNFSQALAFNFYCERRLLPYFSLPANKLFIDCGAHVGRYTLMMARHCKKVIAIEPEPNNYFTLCENIRLNYLKNCIPLQVALWSKPGKKSLYLKEGSGSHSLVEKEGGVGKVTVSVTTVDDLLRRYKIKPTEVGLVKIDVEGAEVEVLRGMRKLLKLGSPRLIVECRKKNIDHLKSILTKLKYKLEIIEETKDSFNLYAEKD